MTYPASTPHPDLPGRPVTGAPGSETGRLLAATDWSATPLGPMEQWPASLRTAASICLNSRFPMFVWWGPSLVNIYNDAYLPILGQRHPQAFARPAREVWSDIWNVLAPQVEQVMQRGRATWNERVQLLVERNGFPEQTWLTWAFSPIHDEAGNVAGLFCACTEETARIEAERERDRLLHQTQENARALQEADQRKDQFLATLSHELRSPLAPIRQAVLVAKFTRDDPRRQEWALDVIERQVGQLALLLDDLLDVSRVALGKLELRLQQVELRGMLNAAVETATPLIEAKRHKLELDLPGHPVHLRVDGFRIAQVVSNLLTNAAKYTDPGGRIRLSAEVRPDELVLRVRDNGIGLSREDRDKIFQMFGQLSTGLDRAEGGLGMGLALSRALVQLHGGTIEAESAGPGWGSEFTVRLPAQITQEAPAVSTPMPAGPSGRKAAALDVLMADDNADALETMSTLLEIEGHRVHRASDGEEALRIAQAVKPPVAILDIGMPGLTGYQVAERLRQTDWGKRIRLIALTGWGQAADQARAMSAGFDHHCTKPVDIERILSLVRPRD